MLRTFVAVAGACLLIVSAKAAVLFPGTSGDYGGVIEAPEDGTPVNSRIMTLGLTDTGRFSTKLIWQGQAYAFK